MSRRRPAQAGAFYEDTEGALRTQIQKSFLSKFGPGSIPTVPGTWKDSILGLMVPHAGYMYSGPVAAHAYYHLASMGIPGSLIILGPNHTGMGSGVSAITNGEWSTPLGDVPIDSELADAIVQASDIIDVDEKAHRNEHSIEVQLPFLQFIYPRRFKFVPVCMMLQDLQTSIDVGEAIVKVAKEHDSTIIIASSDWTHYEPQTIAERKDTLAIQAALELDDERFQQIIEEKGVTACGYGPVTAMMHAVRQLGAKRTELLAYHTSGDITGDKSSVVGYAAATFEK